MQPYPPLPTIQWNTNLKICGDTKDDTIRGRYVIATHPIKKGDILFNVPMNICLLPNAQDEVTTFLRQKLKINKLHIAALVLMHEIALGPSQSKLQHHLDYLPEKICSSLYFDDKAKQLLQSTALDGMLDAMPLQDRWEQSILPIISQKPDWWPSKVATFEEFQRCIGLIMSRGFYDGTEAHGTGPYIVPGVDLLNHSIHPSTYLVQEETKSNSNEQLTSDSKTSKNTSQNCFQMYALHDIQAGSEIFNTYGKLSDAQLLHTYGFVISGESNPHNAFRLQNRFIIEAAKEVMAAEAAIAASVQNADRIVAILDAMKQLQNAVVLLQAGNYLSDSIQVEFNTDTSHASPLDALQIKQGSDTEDVGFIIHADLKLRDDLCTALHVLAMDENEYWAYKTECDRFDDQGQLYDVELNAVPSTKTTKKQSKSIRETKKSRRKRKRFERDAQSTVDDLSDLSDHSITDQSIDQHPNKSHKQLPEQSASSARNTAQVSAKTLWAQGKLRVVAPVLQLAQPWVSTKNETALDPLDAHTSLTEFPSFTSKVHTQSKTDNLKKSPHQNTSTAESKTTSSSGFSINFNNVIKVSKPEIQNETNELDRDESDTVESEQMEPDTLAAYKSSSRPYRILSRALELKLASYCPDNVLETTIQKAQEKKELYSMCRQVILGEQALLLSLAEHADKAADDLDEEAEDASSIENDQDDDEKDEIDHDDDEDYESDQDKKE